MKKIFIANIAVILLAGVGMGNVMADDDKKSGNKCKNLPSHTELTAALVGVVGPENTGLGNDMWATVVNRDGRVCAVTFSGADRGDQWPGSRVISAQKANTANAFSRPSGVMGFAGALSTANLWAATQPGGSLFGLQFSNPVDTAVAYGSGGHVGGNAKRYGKKNDPMVRHFIGGVNVFGGGLALYDADGNLVGALGLSGDTSCSDHIQAWKVRDTLLLDNVPTGVSPTVDDNIIFDLTDFDEDGTFVSGGGFGHPTCLDDAGEKTAAADLPVNCPIGPLPGPLPCIQ